MRRIRKQDCCVEKIGREDEHPENGRRTNNKNALSFFFFAANATIVCRQKSTGGHLFRELNVSHLWLYNLTLVSQILLISLKKNLC